MKALSKHAITATVVFWQRLQGASSFQIGAHCCTHAVEVRSCYLHPSNKAPPHLRSASVLASTKNEENNPDLGELAVELQAYLNLREGATENGGSQQSTSGKTVGGTRGNKLLEYVSAPVPKEMAVDTKYPFDYDELTKYGYSRLVKPIMKIGGRVEAYKLMKMTPPPMSDRLKPKKSREIAIDLDGSLNRSGYRGLSMGGTDDDMGRQLEARKKNVRVDAIKEDYMAPFKDVPKSGFTADWTPAMVDEEARRRGKTIALLKAEEAAKQKADRDEGFVIEGVAQLYSSLTALLIAFAFGRSSGSGLALLGVGGADTERIIQTLALIALAASVGGAVGSTVLATQKNRSSFVWGVKGLLGGPVSLIQLMNLEPLEPKM